MVNHFGDHGPSLFDCHHCCAGYIKDLTGSYPNVYHIIGCGIILSGLVLCMEKIVKKWEKERHTTVEFVVQDSPQSERKAAS